MFYFKNIRDFWKTLYNKFHRKKKEPTSRFFFIYTYNRIVFFLTSSLADLAVCKLRKIPILQKKETMYFSVQDSYIASHLTSIIYDPDNNENRPIYYT